LLGFPGWFLLFFWGAAVGAVEEVTVEEACCAVWLWFSSFVPKNKVDEEAAAILKKLYVKQLLFLLFLSLGSQDMLIKRVKI
jgi:hypothetical protein